MAWDYNSRLRITPWPGSLLALPDLRHRPYPIHGWGFGSHGGVWAPDNTYSSSGSYPTLGESYLELAALDLGDEEGIRKFIDRWGTLGVRWFQDPVSGEQVEDPHYSRIFGPVPAYSASPFADQIALLRASIELASAEAGPNTWIVETLEEFRLGASLIRDLVRAWRWQRDGVAPDSKWEFFPDVSSPDTSDAAAELADDWSHGLLSAFYPQFVRVEVTSSGELRRSDPHFASVPLLSLMALELYDHACEDAEYKTCQNETCGRLFVRQEGRARHGQYRKAGVKYCTSECARAQAQRAYRRRNSGSRKARQPSPD